MAMYRIVKNKDNPYVMLNKYGVYDKKLSWKAKGLLMYFISRPNSWVFYESEIMKNAKDGRDSTRAGIHELIKGGYIKRSQERDAAGRFSGWFYEIFEVPQLDKMGFECINTEEGKSNMEDPKTKNTDLENPILENPTLLNNDSSNKDFNKKDLNNKDFSNYRNVGTQEEGGVIHEAKTKDSGDGWGDDDII